MQGVSVVQSYMLGHISDSAEQMIALPIEKGF